ncbi:MAG TPA: aldo/keto reductase [Gammaproteobacteria bacterium]
MTAEQPAVEHVTSIEGVRLPAILYGTAWKKDATARLVTTAIRLGFRGIDTACQPKHYDEAGVGRGVAAALGPALAREDLYLQTKFTPVPGHDPRRIPYDPAAPLAEQVAQSFEASVRNLGTDYVDCLVLHSPLPNPSHAAEVWQAMEELYRSRRVRQLGISNCYSLRYLEQLHRTADVKPAVVQNRFYAETGYDREIRAFCRDRGIVYQSFWTLTANPQLLAHPQILALGARHGRTAPQILFRYLTQRGVVPLTGTTSEAHMREDLAIFEFALDDAELEAIDALLR